jgi:hypothetical protein
MSTGNTLKCGSFKSLWKKGRKKQKVKRKRGKGKEGGEEGK